MVDTSIKSRNAFNGNRSLVTEYTSVNQGDAISEKTSAVEANNSAPRVPILGKFESVKDETVILDWIRMVIQLWLGNYTIQHILRILKEYLKLQLTI